MKFVPGAGEIQVWTQGSGHSEGRPMGQDVSVAEAKAGNEVIFGVCFTGQWSWTSYY